MAEHREIFAALGKTLDRFLADPPGLGLERR
jgi:hypothetical protein